MEGQWIGGLVIATGIVALGVGQVMASTALQSARRMQHRLASRATPTVIDGWSDWFMEGFCGMAIGVRGLYAVATWMMWTTAGIGFVSLGVRLIGHH